MKRCHWAGRSAGGMAVLGLAVCLAWGTTSQAGAILVAGKLAGASQFKADAGAGGPAFTVRYSTARLDIVDGHVSATVEETIVPAADGGRDCVGLVPMPRDVDSKTLKVELVGGETAQAVESRVADENDARALLESVAKGSRSAAILALIGRPILVLPRVKLEGEIKLRLSYEQSLKPLEGVVMLECPMPAASFAAGPVDRVSLTANIRTDLPLRAMFSPSHECEVERDGPRKATVRLSADRLADGHDFRLCYVEGEDPMGLRVLAHRPDAKEDGFFLVLGNPTGGGKEEVVEKDVLFVLDTSGSMRGEKIEQARSAIEYCLDHLNAGDRFNIVTFGTDVHKFRDGLVSGVPADIEAGKVFIDELVPTGRTNISGALAKGLAGEAGGDRPRIMIFLTDGTPTAGERNPRKILATLPEWNGSRTRVFVMGVGHDVNAHLLDGISESTGGSSEFVAPNEDIDVKVAALYNRLSYPFLNDVTVDFGEMVAKSVFPAKLSALFRGSQVMIAGRYREGGRHEVVIRGTLHGKAREYTCRVDLPSEESSEHAFIAPLWAARNIGFYLQEIRLHGENKELIEEVIRLSRKYGIVTEYTAFLAQSDAPELAPDAARAEVGRRMKEANRVQSGKWAFWQARNDKALQQRTVAAPAANVYVDRQGKQQEAQSIRQIDGQAFYERDGRWVAADEKGDRKLRKVQLFSEEYFELVRENEGFKDAQALGLVTINVGDERIEVVE